MKKTNRYWDKRAELRLVDSERYSDTYINRVKKIYDKAYNDINREIEKIYENYSKSTGVDVQEIKQILTRYETDKTFNKLKNKKYIKENYKSRITRLEQIKFQIYEKAKSVYSLEELESNECYKNVLSNNYYRTIYDTQVGTGYNFSFNTIDEKLVEKLLSEKWSGKNYSQRIWRNTDILAESVSEIVGAGLLNGTSQAKMARELRERFKVAKFYAERLVRTEVNHFNNEADALAYKNMGIESYVFIATLDNRTSNVCQEMDGEIIEYKNRKIGENFPPLHPNCRSTTRGYLGEEAERNLKRRARNPITGETEVIDNINYNDWLDKYVNDSTEKPGFIEKYKENVIIKTKEYINATLEIEKELVKKSNKIISKKLLYNEKNAIQEYAQNGYIDINKRLNGTLKDESKFDDVDYRIKVLDRAIDKFGGLDYDMKLYRYFDLHPVDENYNLMEHINVFDLIKNGNEFKSYTSTSIYDGNTSNFGDCKLIINAPKGTKGVYIGNTELTTFDYEKEFIINRNTKYKLIKADEKNRILEVELIDGLDR